MKIIKCSACRHENPADTRFCGNCGKPLHSGHTEEQILGETLVTPAKELTRGMTLTERYEVIEELGRGGMGKVYRVFDKKIDEEIALKLLKAEVAMDEKAVERFRNELKFARKISHRHVCRMYDINEDNGIHYITMEYVPGEDLKSLIRRAGRLSPSKTTLIIRQVGEGLAEAHLHGIIHRDLKPQNIMIDKDGNSRIMDFGISRIKEAKGQTAAGMIIGTPEYMSPEQIDGKDVDNRSDIYSLGVILYEMLTGRAPFEGETPFSIAVKHKTERPEDPRKINSQIPDDLGRIILKCLEKNKNDRYQTAEDLVEALKRVQIEPSAKESHIIRKKRGTSREITVRLPLNKILFPALIGGALIILLVLLFKIFPRSGILAADPGKTSLAVMYFENNTGNPSLGHWRKALSDLLIADLSQSRYLSILSSEVMTSILKDMDLLQANTYSSDDLKKIGSRGGVEFVLVGKLFSAQDTLRLNTQLLEAESGRVINSTSVEGEGEESVFTMVDELTRKIKQDFQLSEKEIASDLDEHVGKITTSSPEAMKYYREGLRYQESGDYPNSISMMETAIAFDPEFAMAYRAQAVSYSNLGYESEARDRLKKAFDLKDRMSSREQYYIQGQFYSQSETSFDEAIQAYIQLLKIYPEDKIGNSHLGKIYIALEEWDKAIDHLRINQRLKDASVQPYLDLATALSAQGKWKRARKVLEGYLSDHPDNTSILERLSRMDLSQGNLDKAGELADKAFRSDPADFRITLLKGDLFLFQDQFEKADEEFKKILDTANPAGHNESLRHLTASQILQGKYNEAEETLQHGIEMADMLGQFGWKSWYHLNLAYLYKISQKGEMALEECNAAISAADLAGNPARKRKAFYIKGLSYLALEKLKEAHGITEELQGMIFERNNPGAVRLLNHLQGMIYLHQNKPAEAIKEGHKAALLLPKGMVAQELGETVIFDLLGKGYLSSGDPKKALEYFQKISQKRFAGIYYSDVFVDSFFWMGRSYEELGRKEQAQRSYGIFLQYRNGPETDFPKAEQARQRMNLLKN